MTALNAREAGLSEEFVASLRPPVEQKLAGTLTSTTSWFARQCVAAEQIDHPVLVCAMLFANGEKSLVRYLNRAGGNIFGLTDSERESLMNTPAECFGQGVFNPWFAWNAQDLAVSSRLRMVSLLKGERVFAYSCTLRLPERMFSMLYFLRLMQVQNKLYPRLCSWSLLVGRRGF